MALLREALRASQTPEEVAALVEAAYQSLLPELPAITAALSRAAAAAASTGNGGIGGGAGAARSEPRRASPWGGFTGSRRAAGGGGSGGSGSSSGVGSSSYTSGSAFGIGGISGAAGAGAVPSQQEQPWSWESVKHLHAYGLGSLFEYSAAARPESRAPGAAATAAEGAAADAAAPRRGGMRLAQWALVLLLRRQLLPGLAAAPRVSDPAFNNADLAVLRLLGLEGHRSEALLRWAPST
jgi:hypothetical protein